MPKPKTVSLKHTAKKFGGGKLSRSEIVSVRFDAKLRYLAELAARRQRRTLSSFIEWSIEEAIKKGDLIMEFGLLGGGEAGWLEAQTLWDVDEPDRFVKLASRCPELLTHDEQVLWKRIMETPSAWDKNKVIFPYLRKNWSIFKKVANGELRASALPVEKPFKDAL